MTKLIALLAATLLTVTAYAGDDKGLSLLSNGQHEHIAPVELGLPTLPFFPCPGLASGADRHGRRGVPLVHEARPVVDDPRQALPEVDPAEEREPQRHHRDHERLATC